MWERGNSPFGGDGCEEGGTWYECNSNGWMGCCLTNACDYPSGCPSGDDMDGTSAAASTSSSVSSSIDSQSLISTNGASIIPATLATSSPVQTTAASSHPPTSSVSIISSATIQFSSFPATAPSSTTLIDTISTTSSAWPSATTSAASKNPLPSMSPGATIGVICGSLGAVFFLGMSILMYFSCIRLHQTRRDYDSATGDPIWDEPGFDTPSQYVRYGPMCPLFTALKARFKRSLRADNNNSLSYSLHDTPNPNTLAKSSENAYKPPPQDVQTEDSVQQLDSTPIFPQVELESSTQSQLDRSTRSELDDTSPVTATTSPSVVSPITTFSGQTPETPVSPELGGTEPGQALNFPAVAKDGRDNMSMQANLNRLAAHTNNQHVMSWATYNSSRGIDADSKHGLGILSAKEDGGGASTQVPVTARDK